VLFLSICIGQTGILLIIYQRHFGKQAGFRAKMPHSVAVFFGNPVRNRANDVDYVSSRS
jgi:Xaa-Pro aminopeptidase